MAAWGVLWEVLEVSLCSLQMSVMIETEAHASPHSGRRGAGEHLKRSTVDFLRSGLLQLMREWAAVT